MNTANSALWSLTALVHRRRRLLASLMFLTGLVLIGHAAAAPDPPPISGNGGVETQFKPPELAGGNAPTLFERYGWDSYKLDTDLTGLFDGFKNAANSLANILMYLLMGLVQGAIALMQWVFRLDIYRDMHHGVDAVTVNVGNSLFWPLLSTVVVIAGVVIFSRARRSGEHGFNEVVTTAALAAFATAFILAPGQFISAADTVKTQLAGALLSGETSTVTALDRTYTGNAVIDLGNDATFNSNTTDTALRQGGDRIWRTYVVSTWCWAEFKDPAACKRYGPRVIQAKSLTPAEQRLPESEKKKLIRDKNDAWQQTMGEIKSSDPDLYKYVSGQDPSTRLFIALLGLLMAVPICLLFLGLAGAALVASFLLLFFLIFAGMFLLALIVPGLPRQAGLRWVQFTLGTLLQQLVLIGVLGAALAITSLVTGWSGDYPWIMAVALNVTAVAAAWRFRHLLSAVLGIASPATGPSLLSQAVWMRLARGRMHNRRAGDARARRRGRIGLPNAPGAQTARSWVDLERVHTQPFRRELPGNYRRMLPPNPPTGTGSLPPGGSPPSLPPAGARKALPAGPAPMVTLTADYPRPVAPPAKRRRIPILPRAAQARQAWPPLTRLSRPSGTKRVRGPAGARIGQPAEGIPFAAKRAQRPLPTYTVTTLGKR